MYFVIDAPYAPVAPNVVVANTSSSTVSMPSVLHYIDCILTLCCFLIVLLLILMDYIEDV